MCTACIYEFQFLMGESVQLVLNNFNFNLHIQIDATLLSINLNQSVHVSKPKN